MSGCQNDVLCQICAQQYKDTNLPRILTMCGHTYCELCISKMITNNISEQQADGGHPFVVQCPQDGAKLKLTVNQLKCFPKNLALIKVIQSKKNSSSFKQQSINLSNILKLQQNQQDEVTRELISTINQCKHQLANCEVKGVNINASRAEQQSQSNRQQSKQEDEKQKQYSKKQIKQAVDKQAERKQINMQQKANPSNTQNIDCNKQTAKQQVQLQTKKQTKQQNKKNSQQFANKQQKQKKQHKQQDDLCLLHQKPLQIICIMDRKKICSKCAIFGQHKGHEFKSVQQVQKQRNECYMEILQIFKQKQQTQQRIQNRQTQESLMEILNKKKDLLERQVREEFRKLREQVTKQEKSVIKRLNQTYKTTSVKIKSLLKIDQHQLNTFNQWQLKSYQLLKVLQSNNQIQPKVQILYSKSNPTHQLLQNGKSILARIKSHEQNLVNKVENILENLSCQKNTKIVSLLPEYVDIVVREKQKVVEKAMVGGLLYNDRQKVEKANNLTVSTLIIENCKQKNISRSDCSIFDAFSQKNIVQEQGSSLLQGSPLLEESLLDHEQQNSLFLPSSSKLLQCKFQTHQFKPVTHQFQGRKPLQINRNIMNKNIQQDSVNCSFIHLQLQSAKKTAQKRLNEQESDWNQNGRNSLILTSRPSLLSKNSNGQKPTKKKLKSIKISQKYEKMLQGIYNNTVDTIDLTNAEVGDQTMYQICQFVKHSKARTIKFIRNKLTDVGVQKLLPSLSNAQILNLSQNNLTENVLDIFIKHRYGYLSGLKNVILSQNRIIQRKHKAKIEQLRAMNVVVSV